MTDPSTLQLEFQFSAEGPNPSGFCMCGCGELAPIGKQTNAKTGRVKGKPLRFVRGHGSRRSVNERFWDKVDKSGGPDACWEWLGVRSKAGYGYFRIGAKTVKSHRLSWEIHGGELPMGEGWHGMCVLHHCDNPPCCNPRHLFLGTHQDNMDDMIAKGRHSHKGARPGEDHHMAKLTEKDVLAIRERAENGEIWSKIAREYGVVRVTVSRIVLRQTWRHIT